MVGILLGSFFANHFSGNRLSIINNSSNKIIDLFHLIDDQYVDTVNIPELVEKAMPQILKELDPHSTYISATKVEESMQDLKGSFSGIGVQFTLYKDTIRVVKVVNVPVTVKTRLGWDCENLIITDLAEQLQDCGIQAPSPAEILRG